MYSWFNVHQLDESDELEDDSEDEDTKEETVPSSVSSLTFSYTQNFKYFVRQAKKTNGKRKRRQSQ